MFLGLTRRQLILILVFTLVETVGLALWLVLAGLPFQAKYGAVGILFAFLLVEHVLAGLAARP
ncbi:MAG: hypothetical protein ACRD2L_17585 [Terriglobia bacterium]